MGFIVNTSATFIQGAKDMYLDKYFISNNIKPTNGYLSHRIIDSFCTERKIKYYHITFMVIILIFVGNCL